MELNAFWLYVLLTIPTIGSAMTGVGTVGLMLLLGGGWFMRFIGTDVGEEAKVALGERLIRWWPLPAIVLAISLIIPSETTVLAVIVWKLGSAIDGLAELPSSFIDYLDALLKEKISEMASGE